jgi:hypothetical protein
MSSRLFRWMYRRGQAWFLSKLDGGLRNNWRAAKDPAGPSFFAALEQQLGLKLSRPEVPGKFLLFRESHPGDGGITCNRMPTKFAQDPAWRLSYVLLPI